MAKVLRRPRRPRETQRQKVAFEVWYELGRNCLQTAKALKVHENSIYAWRERFHWDERADNRDAEVLRALEREATRRHVQMIERHRKALFVLFNRALERLQEPLDSENAAIMALEKAIRLERELEGLPSWVMEVVNADDATVVQMAQRAAKRLGLLGPVASGGATPEPEAGNDSES